MKRILEATRRGNRSNYDYQSDGLGMFQGSCDVLVNRIGWRVRSIRFYIDWIQNFVSGAAAKLAAFSIFRCDGGRYASACVCLEHIRDEGALRS